MPTRPALTPKLRAFIERQPLFFVATADEGGRVNVSPKGMNTLRTASEQATAPIFCWAVPTQVRSH